MNTCVDCKRMRRELNHAVGRPSRKHRCPLHQITPQKLRYLTVVNRRNHIRQAKAKDSLGGVCSYPGCEVRDKRVLQFAHKDPSTKCFSASIACISDRSFWKEVEKCELLCANHHVLLTHHLIPPDELGYGYIDQNTVI